MNAAFDFLEKKLCPAGKAAAKAQIQGLPFSLRKWLGSTVLQRQVPRQKGEEEMTVQKNLNRWFKEKWVDVSRKDLKNWQAPAVWTQ